MEQAHLNYWNGTWGFKGGVVLVPSGIINEYHEPPTFMSVERPAYAKYIIPTTWFDNGMQFNYNYGDFRFGVTLMEDVMVVHFPLMAHQLMVVHLKMTNMLLDLVEVRVMILLLLI